MEGAFEFHNSIITMRRSLRIATTADLSDPGNCRPWLDGILGSSGLGFGICDNRLRVLATNETLAKMLGVKARASLGKHVRAFLGRKPAEVLAPLKNVLQNGREVPKIELSGKLPGRSRIVYAIASYFPIKNPDGRVKQVGILTVDVTEQKEAQLAFRNICTELIRKLLSLAHDSEAMLESIRAGRIPEEVDQNLRAVATLSPREQEILRLTADGIGNKQIASTLGITVKTVEAHKARIRLKLHLQSSQEMIRYAIANNLINLGSPVSRQNASDL
jgi:DNA-binding CsgD family transcriptional regulator